MRGGTARVSGTAVARTGKVMSSHGAKVVYGWLVGIAIVGGIACGIGGLLAIDQDNYSTVTINGQQCVKWDTDHNHFMLIGDTTEHHGTFCNNVAVGK